MLCDVLQMSGSSRRVTWNAGRNSRTTGSSPSIAGAVQVLLRHSRGIPEVFRKEAAAWISVICSSNHHQPSGREPGCGWLLVARRSAHQRIKQRQSGHRDQWPPAAAPSIPRPNTDTRHTTTRLTWSTHCRRT
ncbi:hypothetical protein V5799_016869 [Amblyomma americanum]|uniref:Uncharacterized protein n=1 Tax=Amblyomma americanum TaxID=6943 RepID=A0AAQ4F3R0_AMBAM